MDVGVSLLQEGSSAYVSCCALFLFGRRRIGPGEKGLLAHFREKLASTEPQGGLQIYFVCLKSSKNRCAFVYSRGPAGSAGQHQRDARRMSRFLKNKLLTNLGQKALAEEMR